MGLWRMEIAVMMKLFGMVYRMLICIVDRIFVVAVKYKIKM